MADRFQVIEYSSFFAVRDTVTRQEHLMGDGVDTVLNDGGHALTPGTPGFCEALAMHLNASESETLEAYFPETYESEAET